MRKVIRVILIFVVLLLVAYLIFVNIPQATIKSKDAIEKVEATMLYKAFNDSEQEAENKYLGKVLEVTGTIDELYEDENGTPVVVLKNETGDPVVLVTLDAGQAKLISRYSEGSQIRLKALCSGMLMEVTLTKGIIIE